MTGLATNLLTSRKLNLYTPAGMVGILGGIVMGIVGLTSLRTRGTAQP